MEIIALENKNFAELNPVDCGYEECASNHSFGPSIRRYYLIHYVVSGCGEFSNKDGNYAVSAGEAFLIKPDETTFYKANDTTPWTYIWIGFTGNLCKMLDKLSSPIFKCDEYLFKSILNVKNMDSMHEEFLTGKIFLIFAEIFKESKKYNYVEMVENYINANYMKKITIDEIAKSVNLDRRYLSRIFKSKLGVNMKYYLTKVRMCEATKMLKCGNSVASVAYMVGYDDAFVFSKAFKLFYGFAPKNVAQTQ